MLFFTWTFAVFFLIFYPLFLLVRGRVRARNLLLIAAAFIFYGWWDVRFLSLLAFTTGLDYLTALGASGRIVTRQQVARSCAFLAGTAAIALVANGFEQLALMTLPIAASLVLYVAAPAFLNRIGDEVARRRAWVWLCVVVNLAVLGFFKYYNFFGESLDAAFGSAGIDIGFVTLNIILPLGISFHTFQSIGRTIDVSRGKLEPSTDFVEFATFLTYFPQILAGPIERANHMLPQFRNVMPITRDMIAHGTALFLWGMFKKVVVADNMAAIANPLFADPAGATSGELLVAALAFSFQIYGDFSGYTDMARGLAKLMGFDLQLNFRLPYFARTPSEFWQRWHISLSQWLRDYLYIALGGNRGSKLATLRNLMLTMLLGGLWHGAAWTFIMWGFLHGALLVIYRIAGFDDWLEARQDHRAAPVINVLAWAALMPSIVLTWIYFRAESMASAWHMVSGVLRFDNLGAGAWSTLGFYVVPLFAIETVIRLGGDRVALPRLPFLLRYSVYLALILALMTLQSGDNPDFIYFDF